MTDTVDTTREQAEAFVRERMDKERSEHEQQLADALRLEKEVSKEFDKADKAYWKLASKDLDAEPTADEKKAAEQRDALMRRIQQISRAITSHRETLVKLDDPYEFERRVREKEQQLGRGRNDDNEGGTTMSKTVTKRTPVPQATVDRVVKLVETKSQQEVADILNKEGKTTASGKPWTPQNIWHLVKKATGKGVPRKQSERKTGTARKTTTAARKTSTASRKNGTAARKTASAGKRQATPLSKSAQASGTSRGGAGSRKKTGSKSRPVGRKS